MMAVVAWGTLVITAWLIPAFVVIFPGQIPIWIKAIPSYFMVDILNRAINYSVGWGGNWLNVLILTGFCLVSLGLGIFLMYRKVRCA
jgi:hypothetical protein